MIKPVIYPEIFEIRETDMIQRFSFICVLLGLLLVTNPTIAQHDNHNHNDEHATEEHHDHNHDGDAHAAYDPVSTVMHHIGNSNEFHLFGDYSIPLPCILYHPEDGLQVFLSSKFEHGHSSYNGYILNHGVVERVNSGAFPRNKAVHIDSIVHDIEVIKDAEGKETKTDVYFVASNGVEYPLEKASTLVAFTSWYDFSISKVVFSMLLVSLILIFVFLRVAKAYKTRKGQAPKGLQSLLEPVILFMRDEVIEPAIGPKYERYLPFLMTLFFFILTCNLLGLIPFFPGSANITGNIAVTMVLAIITFLIVTFSGNRHYWEHILWMPGLPLPVKLLITPIEIIGMFTKPFSLLIRLFANITAGHIIILSLVGLIFVFGQAGESLGGALGGMAVAIPFTLFMNVIEIIVAFIQAFIFTVLAASYIGAAVEEGHGHEEAHH